MADAGEKLKGLFMLNWRWRVARLSLVIGVLLAWSAWASTVRAQPPAQLVVDFPAEQSEVGPELTIRGWAVGPAEAGTVVDTIHVYLGSPEGGIEGFLGAASYGLPRPDVAASAGTLAGVGYELRVHLPPGEHILYVFARTDRGPAGVTWSEPSQVAVTVLPTNAARETAPSGTPRIAQPPRSSAVPPSIVLGDSVCHQQSPSGQCLAYSVANGGGGMACREIDTQGECVGGYSPSHSVSTACARPGEGGVCLAYATSPPVNSPPGGVGQSTALCVERTAAGQCARYSGGAAPEATVLALSTQLSGGMTTLNWSTIRAAAVYTVLRCATPVLASCSVVTRSTASSYQMPQGQSYYYVVQALDADGRVLATSNLLGRL
jgi:hypothetical protein